MLLLHSHRICNMDGPRKLGLITDSSHLPHGTDVIIWRSCIACGGWA